MFNPFGHLGTGAPFSDDVLDLFAVQCRALFRDVCSKNNLSPLLVGDANYWKIRDARMHENRVFHFDRTGPDGE